MALGRLLGRLPATKYLLGLAAVVGALAVSSWLLPDLLWERFVEPYLWRPIALDEGYNVVNTLFLLVVLFFTAGWIYGLLRKYQIHLDIVIIVAGLPLQAAGSMLRVLEDSDYFAPFREDVARVRPDLPPGATCVPELGGVLDSCLGAFFVTPPIYVWLILVLGGVGRLALQAERVGRWKESDRAALRFYAITWAAFLALALAWDASDPGYVRFVPPWPWLLSCVVIGGGTFGVLWRHRGRYDWRDGLLGYFLAIFVYVLFPVLVWLSGGSGAWRPAAPTLPALLGLAAAATLAFVVVLAYEARLLAGRRGARVASARRTWLFLGYLALFQGFALFFALGGAVALTSDAVVLPAADAFAWTVLGGAVLVVGGLMARGFSRTRGVHPTAARLGEPLNLLVIGSQFADGLMTSLALDLFGTSEKHVLPRTLIALVDSLEFMPDYPALIVMIPFKVVLSFLLIWLLDVRLGATFQDRPNVPRLIKSVILIVGFTPAMRDVLRLSLGV